MDNQDLKLDSENVTVFSTTTPPTWASQNAYNQLPPSHVQANLSNPCFPPTMHSIPPPSFNSNSPQLIEPSCNSLNVNPSSHFPQSNINRPPPNFNFCNKPIAPPPPFSTMNAMTMHPPTINFNDRGNGPSPFPGGHAKPNGSPPFQASFPTRFNRPSFDSNHMPAGPFQTNFNDRFEKPPFSNNLYNLSERPPFPTNYLPPPHDTCHSSKFETNHPPHDDHSSNNLGKATYSNLLHEQQPPFGSSKFIPQFRFPPQSTLPLTSNNSYTTYTGCPPYPTSSPWLSQRPPRVQPVDSFARQFTTSNKPQDHHMLSHDSLHEARVFSQDQSGPGCSQTSLGAGRSCSVLPPSSSEEESEHGLATTRTSKLFVPPIPFHPLHLEVISSKKDQDWINKWLEERLRLETEREKVSVNESSEKKSNTIDQITESKSNCRHKNILKLDDVHGQVVKYNALLDELRQCHHGEDEAKAASVKVKLDEISAQLLDPAYQSSVQRLVSTRRKKRARARNSRRARHQRWQVTSRDMDCQRELLCRQYKTEERQKCLVAEADAVLREVRGKKEDTVSLQLLLAALRDLRQHRLNKGDHQGYVATQHHTEHFQKITERLDEMLESHLQDYELEERALQVMLDQQRGSDKASVATLDCKRVDETSTTSLAEVLFGDTAPTYPGLLASYTAADTSREMLLGRRCAWDKHLVEVGGSGIPICWVTPPENPSGGWEKWKEQSF